MNGEVLVKMTSEEYIRVEAIQLDNDERDALAMVKMLLSRIEDRERMGIM